VIDLVQFADASAIDPMYAAAMQTTATKEELMRFMACVHSDDAAGLMSSGGIVKTV
jgi:hypothetical protein